MWAGYKGVDIKVFQRRVIAGEVFKLRLTAEEGLECVHNYSKLTKQPVTEVSAVVMNELTKSDPFYISSVFESDLDDNDLRTTEGVIEAFKCDRL